MFRICRKLRAGQSEKFSSYFMSSSRKEKKNGENFRFSIKLKVFPTKSFL